MYVCITHLRFVLYDVEFIHLSSIKIMQLILEVFLWHLPTCSWWKLLLIFLYFNIVSFISCITHTVVPPNTADLGTDEIAAVFGNRRYWESYITYKTFIWDLEMSGGIKGEGVLEGAVLGGTTVVKRKVGSSVPRFPLCVFIFEHQTINVLYDPHVLTGIELLKQKQLTITRNQ